MQYPRCGHPVPADAAELLALFGLQPSPLCLACEEAQSPPLSPPLAEGAPGTLPPASSLTPERVMEIDEANERRERQQAWGWYTPAAPVRFRR